VAVSRAFAAEALSAEAPDLTALLAGRPGGTRADCGALVCSCFDVGAKTIEAAVREGTCRSVDDVTRLLKAGGNCGSCRPEIRGIIDGALRTVPA
jgi:assimilatory nitrate reductase catalytic subunit